VSELLQVFGDLPMAFNHALGLGGIELQRIPEGVAQSEPTIAPARMPIPPQQLRQSLPAHKVSGRKEGTKDVVHSDE
jgi:hypothetical protein